MSRKKYIQLKKSKLNRAHEGEAKQQRKVESLSSEKKIEQRKRREKIFFTTSSLREKIKVREKKMKTFHLKGGEN